jgi:Single-strand binding protein family
MLNKIKIIGEVFLPIKTKIKIINKVKEDGVEEEEKRVTAYFSLRVPTPNNSLSILRCFAQREIAESLEQEVGPGDVIEVKGYLRNERENRQMLVIAVKFTKLDIKVEEIDCETSDQVQLIGKIITDVQGYQTNAVPPVLSFKISVPREKNEFPLYFCRAQGQLATEVQKQLKKNDIILLEGYLQTVKVPSDTGRFEERDSRISSIICQGFTLLGSDSVDDFAPPGQFTRVVRPVEKIDFSKESPKKPKIEE